MSVHDMEFIRMETNSVTGITRAMGGSGDPSILTALGVFVGMKAALKKKSNIQSLKGLKIGVQGFGKVGYYLCSHLKSEGAKIYGYDINQESLDRVVKEFGVIPVDNDELISMNLDVFSPCAMGAIINPSSIKNLSLVPVPINLEPSKATQLNKDRTVPKIVEVLSFNQPPNFSGRPLRKRIKLESNQPISFA